MKGFPITATILIILTIAVMVFKVIHFIKNVNRKNLLHFIFFPHVNIVVSSTKKSADVKLLQNFLTQAILVLVVLSFFAYYGMP